MTKILKMFENNTVNILCTKVVTQFNVQNYSPYCEEILKLTNRMVKIQNVCNRKNTFM